MALSDDEQRWLNELKISGEPTDPGFAAGLDTAPAKRWEHRQAAFACSAALLGILAMLAGLGAARGLISIGAIILCYGFLLTAWGVGTGVQILRRRLLEAGRTREYR